MPNPQTLNGIHIEYSILLVNQNDSGDQEAGENLAPPNMTDVNGAVWVASAEFEVDSGNWIVSIQAQNDFWATDNETFNAGPDFNGVLSGSMETCNGRNGWTVTSFLILFDVSFSPADCLCILNTLHCAGLTLARLCGTDVHTAAVILGTAGGIVRGGIKADASRANGILGGWWSWH